MSHTPAFLLPEGLTLALGTTSLMVRHDGDVYLEQSLGRRLSRVEAGGSLTLAMSPITGVVKADGVVRILGDVDAEEIRGKEVYIGAHNVRCVTIFATERVVIESADLDCDVIIAPEVIIHPEASGRVRIVDCHNERTPLRVRGCLSLEEFEQDFGGVSDFLARRGVIPINPLPTATSSDVTDDDASEGRGRGRRGLLRPSSDSPSPRRERARPAEAWGTMPPVAAREISREIAPVPTPPPAPTPTPPPVVAKEVPPDPAPVFRPPAEEHAVSLRIDTRTRAPVEAARPTLVDALADADDEQGIIEEISQEEASLVRQIQSEISVERKATPDRPAPPVSQIEDKIPGLIVRRNTQPRPRVDLARHEARVKRITQRIAGSYDGDAPAPVAEMMRLVERGRMEALATGLDKLWCDTLRAHLEREDDVPRAVVQGYQALHAMRTQAA